ASKLLQITTSSVRASESGPTGEGIFLFAVPGIRRIAGLHSEALRKTTCILGPAPASDANWARGATTSKRSALRIILMRRLRRFPPYTGIGEQPIFSNTLEPMYARLRST